MHLHCRFVIQRPAEGKTDLIMVGSRRSVMVDFVFGP